MKSLLGLLIAWVKKNKLILCLSLFYFIFRLINLTKLPIFNDEAIYLDWGWRETHRAGYLYYSLYDAKQPFLMWIFGVAENIFPDPLFAGRLISVCAGFLTFIGIYKLAKDFFVKEIGLIAVFLYTITPFFSFYDRQALMESSIAAVGIWACYLMLKTLTNPRLKKFPIFLGIVLGIGFFIKSSSLLFVGSWFFVSIVYIIFSKKIRLINSLVTAMTTFLIVIFFLLINPQFWETLSSNSRYSLTLAEALAFPLKSWVNAFTANMQISLTFITPPLLLISLVGIIYILWKKQRNQLLFLLFFTLALLVATLLVRTPSDRYLVSFLPFLVIPAAYILLGSFHKQKILGIVFSLVIFSIPFCLTVLQLINPPLYITKTLPYSLFVNSVYLRGVTSGYGINETMDYLKNISKNKTIVVGVAENTGNPESALMTYSNKYLNMKVVYFAPELLPTRLNDYDCLRFDTAFYFIARDEQQAGLEKFLQKIKTIKNLYGENTIGVYGLRKDCVGKSLKLQINPT